jgi:hypothetical protein
LVSGLVSGTHIERVSLLSFHLFVSLFLCFFVSLFLCFSFSPPFLSPPFFFLSSHSPQVPTQTRPIGMTGPQQFAMLSFSDFVAALLGITGTRASIFTCLPTSTQRAMALGCWLRKASNDWNESIEVLKYRESVIKNLNMGDTQGKFLEHGSATPSCMLKLQRMWGDQAADYNWWYDYTTPEHMVFEHRYSDAFRTNLGDSMFIALEIIEIVLAKAVKGLHLCQPIQRELPMEDEGSEEEEEEDDMGNSGGGWDDKPRQPTPAYVER